MANLNDFKLIKLKSKKIFNYSFGDQNISVSDEQKERLGFYSLILENINGFFPTTGDIVDENDYDADICTIIDTEYNNIINNIKVDDLGIDAVSISRNNDDEIDIRLFNFKYRSTFNADKTKSENDISRSTKFLEYISKNTKVNEQNHPVVGNVLNLIINHLNSNKICNISMYMVSNEAKGFAANSNEYIDLLENNFGMKIINISLDEIMSFYNTKAENQSTFLISQNEFLSFQSDENSTQKSYIVKLSLLDLIRITAINSELANNYSLENDEILLDSQLDLSLLYENVRGYLGDTTYNKNIIETLKGQHFNFFMFNNGITITSENIQCTAINSGLKYRFEINNYQIVNGGQSLRSIYKFLSEDHDDKLIKLRGAHVLIRIFKTQKDTTLQNQIAEYTNSQNKISDVDLKSIDSVQIQIEQFLAESDILYVRKAGEVGGKDNSFHRRITMEKLAQILYSSSGYPERATNQKKKLFKSYYKDIFYSENFSLEKSLLQINKFFDIQNFYKVERQSYKVMDQKIFYILHAIENFNIQYDKSIDFLEQALETYEADVSQARKLIQKGFKSHFDEFVKKNLNLIVE